MKKHFTLWRLLTLLLAVIWTMPAIAQMSAGGTPPSFSYEPGRATLMSTINIPIDFDVEAMKIADKKREAEGRPPVMAQVIPLDNLTTDNSGEWTTLPNGQHIWRLRITAKDALGVNLTYDKFEIPAGGKLFIYSPSHSRVLGAYTSANNPKRKEYATEFLPYDELILEYAPPVGNFTSPIVITGLGYGYNYITVSGGSRYGGTLERPCHIDINCPDGVDWQNEKKGVARIIILMGGQYGMCSGTIVNNTAENLDPLYLTAWHCVHDATTAQLNQSLFYFHFEQADCGGTSSFASLEAVSPTITGGTILAMNALGGGSDGALLQLNEGADNESKWYRDNNIFFNGWDRRNAATTSGAGIHHPAGNPKKISISTTNSTISGNHNFGASGVTVANGHLSVKYSKGVVEGGSSGSPFFDQNHRVVGTLSGSSSYQCDDAATQDILYGRLWYHFDGPVIKDQWLKPYLDPKNSGQDFIDGIYEPGAKLALFNVSPAKIYSMESTRFRDASVGAYTWDWELPGGTPSSHSGTSWATKNPPPVQYTAAGVYGATLTINKGTPDELVYALPNAVTVGDKTIWNPCGPTGTGTSVAGCPFGPTTPVSNVLLCALLSSGCGTSKILSAALYDQAELGCIAGTRIIKGMKWTCNTALNAARTVKIYLKLVPATMTSCSYTQWGQATTGATLVGQYAGVTNDVGDFSFTFNMVDNFVYDPAYNLVVLTETDYGSADTRNPNVRYTTKANTFRYATLAPSANPATGTALTSSGNRPNVTFFYDMGYLDPPAADFAMTGDPAPGKIYEGGYMTFTDISTGPPVLWEWKVDGTNFTSSTLQNPPVARYMDEGIYDISLKIINTKGSSSVTKNVEVYSRIPVPNFYGWSGLLRRSNSGPFLSHDGGTVVYEDASERYPKAWEWSMPGADITTSTEREVTVTYPAGMNEYSVEFKSSNSAGTSTTVSRSNFVKTGGTEEVWNVLPGETPNMAYTINLGQGCGFVLPVTGSGSYYYCAAEILGYCISGQDITIFPEISERFTLDGPGQVDQVRVYTQSVSGSGNMTVAIYSDRGGVPDIRLSPVMNVSSPVNGGYNTITFPTPVGVNKAFHVVLSYTGGRKYIVPSVPSRVNGFGTACGNLYGENWLQLGNLRLSSLLCQPGVTTEVVYTSMNVVPRFTYTKAELLSDDYYRRKDVDPTVTEIHFEGTGAAWSVRSIHDCFNFSASSGTMNAGAGSFSFTMKNNTEPNMRLVQFTLSIGGVPYLITVLQGGSFPEEFKAEYDDAVEDILLTWKGEDRGAADRANVTKENNNTKVASAAAISAAAPLLGGVGVNIPIVNNVGSSLNPIQRKKLTGQLQLGDVISSDANITRNAGRASERELRWDDGSHQRTVGYQGGGIMSIAVYFEPMDLFNYTEITIKAVDLYIGAKPTGSTTQIRILQGDDVVYTQSVPVADLTATAWNRITLTTPRVVDLTKDLLVAFRFTHESSVAVIDNGPGVYQKGDLLGQGDDNDDYFSLIDASGGGIEGNWNFVLIVDAETMAPPTYNIFRDKAPLNLAKGVKENYYHDRNITIAEDYCYKISATYMGDPFFESIQSPAECVFTKSPLHVTADNKTIMETDPIPSWTRTVTGTIFAGDDIDDILSISTYTNIATTASPAGTYTIGIETDNLMPSKYAVKDIDGLLTITSYPNTIYEQPIGSITCEGGEYTFSINGDGLDVNYQWQKLVSGAWEDIPGATDNVYTISEITREDAGQYRVVMKGRTAVTTSEVVELKVAIEPLSILAFEWDELPTVNCNTETNGGYKFVGFQWYKNGVAVPGATKPYLHVKPNTPYDCEMLLDDGRKFRLCDFVTSRGMALMIAYPNPVTNGTNLTVRLEDAVQGSVVNIYDMGGNSVKSNIPMQGSSATVNISGMAAGIYIVQLVSPDGVKRTTQVVVK